MNVLTILILCTLQTLVSSHSWVECTDYRKDVLGNDYDNNYCLGFSRDYLDYDPAFGSDSGMNYQPGDPNAIGTWCKDTIGNPSTGYSDTYTSSYPMAQYTAGDTIKLLWPSKNHANYGCPFAEGVVMPDTSLRIFVNSQANPSSDPQALTDWTQLWDFHKGYTWPQENYINDVPFQNCPAFCEDQDKAVCYGEFDLTGNNDAINGLTDIFTQSGYYTFMWLWGFQNEDDFYSACWEAYVDTSNPIPTPTPTDEPPPSVAPTDASNNNNDYCEYEQLKNDSLCDSDPCGDSVFGEECLTYDSSFGCVLCDYGNNFFKFSLNHKCIDCGSIFTNGECKQCMDFVGCLECNDGYTRVHNCGCHMYECIKNPTTQPTESPTDPSALPTNAPSLPTKSPITPTQFPTVTNIGPFVCPVECDNLSEQNGNQVCDCNENPNCSACNIWGCEACDSGYFFKNFATPCLSCHETFIGCESCVNWSGCEVCESGFVKTWDAACGLNYCQAVV